MSQETMFLRVSSPTYPPKFEFDLEKHTDFISSFFFKQPITYAYSQESPLYQMLSPLYQMLSNL